MQVDTTRLDVMAIVEDGKPVRPELTIALEVATRSVLAAVLREEGTKAVDAALLLAEMAVPHPVRPGWPEQLRLAHAAVPYERLARPGRTASAGGGAAGGGTGDDRHRPRGNLRLHRVPGRLRNPRRERAARPAPRPHCQRLRGADLRQHQHALLPARRRLHRLRTSSPAATTAQDEARFTVAQLQELLDEWITACWQHRPHDGLRHPLLPKKALTPNEMWGALLGASGYVPLPLTGGDYLELLPVRCQPVTGRGIRIHHRTYDHTLLNEHRGRPCPTGADGKWEVHLNPHDVRQIYIRLPDGQLHEIPWIHRDHVHAPVSETTWRHLRSRPRPGAATARQHEAALAEAADQLLRRSPAPCTSTAAGPRRRHAPGTTGHPAQARPAHDSPTAQRHRRPRTASTPSEAHAHDDRRVRPMSEEPSPPATGFALYDAYEEAEHW